MRTVFAVLVAVSAAVAMPLFAGTVTTQLSTENVCTTQTVTVVSDITNQYIAEDNSLQDVVETYSENPAWLFAEDIQNNDAVWVWPTYLANPAGETQTITKSFELEGTVKSASIRFLADNSYKLYIGGNLAAEDAGLYNFETVTTVDVASYLTAGTNTLSFEVTNETRPSLDAFNNPAGVKYVLEVETETCTTTSQCQTTVFSGTDHGVSETKDGQTTAAVETWDENASWTASVDNTDAAWIWSDYLVTEPNVDQTRWFTKTFAIDGNIDTASLKVAADNTYEVHVNNVQVGMDTDAYNFRAGDEDVYDLSTYLVEGVNQLAFKVTNQALGNDPETNPAGLLYSLEVVTTQDGDTCVFDTNEIPVITVDPETITFKVDNPYTGDIYTDGVTADDAEDGDLTTDVVVTGDTVDMTTVGTYVITYNVTDSDGNNAVEQSRTVIVEPADVIYVCTEDFVSAAGNTTLYAADGDQMAVPTYVHSSWGSIDDATWIWEEYLVSNPEGGRGGLKMYRTIDIPGTVVSGTATLGYDNRGDFTVNGTEAVNVYDNYYNFLPEKIKTWDITNYLVEGENNLEWTGHNNSSSVTSPYSNPAGVIYKITVQYESTDPTCDPTGDNIPVITVDPEVITLNVGDFGPHNPDLMDGVTANDVEDGDITSDVVTSGDYIYGDDIETQINLVLTSKSNLTSVQIDSIFSLLYAFGWPTGGLTSAQMDSAAGLMSSFGASSSSVDDFKKVLNGQKTILTPANIGTYTIFYNVTDSDGNDAVEKTRTYIVEDGFVNNLPVITVDPETITLTQSGFDPDVLAGVTADDVEDGDITANLVVGGDIVDGSTVGTYIVTYNVTDSHGGAAIEKTRTYIIEAPANEAPVVTVDPDTETLVLGQTYTGTNIFTDNVTATDLEDGDLTDDITWTGNIDWNNVGVYIITYSVTDSDGAVSEPATKTVNIVAPIYVCSDGIDNDEDGKTDIEDPACHTDGNPDNKKSYDPTIDTENEAPVISLLGDNPLIIDLGDTYFEGSAVLTDPEEGVINENLVIDNSSVDTLNPGVYYVTYNGADNGDPVLSAEEVIRTVVVKTPGSCYALGKVNTNEIRNWNNGDTEDKVFVGGNTGLSTQAWFPIFFEDAAIVDGYIDTYADNAGLAIERRDGSVRAQLFGSHGKNSDNKPAGKEHFSGHLEFMNATPTTQTNDLTQDKTEKPFDGTGTGKYKAGDDELWLNSDQSHFWLTVTTADDGFFTDFTVDCLTPNQPPVITVDPEILSFAGATTGNPILDGVTADDVEDGDITADIKVTTFTTLDEKQIFLGEYLATKGLSTSEIALVQQTIDVAQTSPADERTDNVTPGEVHNLIRLSMGYTDVDTDAIAALLGSTATEPFLSAIVDFSNRYAFAYAYDVADSEGLDAVTQYRLVTIRTNEIPEIFVNPAEVTLSLNATAPDLMDGVTARDFEDGYITSDVTASGSVDVTTVGTYTITYNVTDSDGNDAVSQTRTYKVQDGNGGGNNAPVLTVDPATLQFTVGDTPTGNPILDGVTATDVEDGDLTDDIVVLDDDGFDINTIGIYTISYEVTDSNGAKATGTRTIAVGETQGDNIPVITVDPETVTLTVGDAAPDVLNGVTADDVEDGDITADLVVSGETVDTNTVGTYVVKYDVTDSDSNDAVQKERTYVVEEEVDPCVVNTCSFGGGPTNIRPVIVLNGDDPQQVNKGDDYTELGAIANDAEDGQGLTVTDIDASDVNTDVIGTYLVRYNFKDSKGLPANQVVRQVVVGEVAGETFVPVFPNCELRFTKWMKRGDRGAHVADMQSFLNDHMDAGLTVDGIFGGKTFRAVQNYQILNRAVVLTPWGLANPTGWAYKTTRAKMNYDTGCAEPSKLLDHINREWVTDFTYIGWVDEQPDASREEN